MEKTTHIKKTPGRIAARVAIYFVLVVTAVSTIFPYMWMVLASFKTGLEITTYPEQIFPENPSFAAYADAFGKLKLGTGLKNTLALEVFSVRSSRRWGRFRSPSSNCRAGGCCCSRF